MTETIHGVRFDGKINVAQRITFGSNGILQESVDMLLGPDSQAPLDANGKPIYVELHRPPKIDSGSVIES